jgi:hypothetical protein
VANQQLARRLGISHETVRRKAIAGELPCTVVCRGSRKTTRRYPPFANEFAASGLHLADLAEFTARWRPQVAEGERGQPAKRRVPTARTVLLLSSCHAITAGRSVPAGSESLTAGSPSLEEELPTAIEDENFPEP